MDEQQKLQITNRERKEKEHTLREEQKLIEQKRRDRRIPMKRIRPWAITAVALAVIGFVGWWGISTMAHQKATQVAVSSEGVMAPDFTLPSTTGGNITLSDFRGKKNVLIYFNEGLSCAPCMQQIPELEKNMADFQRMNVEVLAVMLDPVDQLKQAESQYGIKQIPMLSYANAKTEQDYNLLPFSMGMGRRAGHTFVLVGEDGKILWRKDYWPGYGMMIAGGSMFIESKYIVQAVQEHLNSQ